MYTHVYLDWTPFAHSRLWCSVDKYPCVYLHVLANALRIKQGGMRVRDIQCNVNYGVIFIHIYMDT